MTARADKWPSLETTKPRCSPAHGPRDLTGLLHPSRWRNPEDRSLLEATSFSSQAHPARTGSPQGPPETHPGSEDGSRASGTEGTARSGGGSTGTA